MTACLHLRNIRRQFMTACLHLHNIRRQFMTASLHLRNIRRQFMPACLHLRNIRRQFMTACLHLCNIWKQFMTACLHLRNLRRQFMTACLRLPNIGRQISYINPLPIVSHAGSYMQHYRCNLRGTSILGMYILPKILTQYFAITNDLHLRSKLYTHTKTKTCMRGIFFQKPWCFYQSETFITFLEVM